MDFYAHSTERSDKADWQSLAEHLTAVGELAADKAKYFNFDGRRLAEAAGLLHDLGKYTKEFQQRLEGNPVRVDHATHGAITAVDRYGSIGQLLAYAIAGHHAGLANGRDNGERTSLKDRLNKELPELLTYWENEISLPKKLGPPTGFKPMRNRGTFQLAFLGRVIVKSGV